MPDSVINLYSDTQTRPSAEMRKAMRAQIDRERRTLAPLLGQLGE